MRPADQNKAEPLGEAQPLVRLKPVPSLSQLARKITGTRWNGPAFFGLRKRSGRAGEVRSDGQ